MKKVLLVLAVAFSVTACNKCVDCTNCPEGVTLDQTELCQDDFDSKDDYNSAVALIEAFDCECN